MSSYYDIMNGIKWTQPLADIIDGPLSTTRLAESMDSWRRMSEIATSSLQLPGEGIRSIIAQEQEMWMFSKPSTDLLLTQKR